MPHRAIQSLATLDTTRIDDTRIGAVRPLITPALLQEWLPTPPAASALVESSRHAIANVLNGTDDRLLVVVGPCSIHDHDQAMAYARELKALADQYANDLLIVMRVYFEKPRTTVGWKGYINDPHLDGSFAINEGLEMARKLLLDVLDVGLPVGTEFLDLLSPQFISDLVSWGAIGARTTESQSHRQLASGLSCPVGFKNGTDGGVKVATEIMSTAFSAIIITGWALVLPPTTRGMMEASTTRSPACRARAAAHPPRPSAIAHAAAAHRVVDGVGVVADELLDLGIGLRLGRRGQLLAAR
jgi:3-deoxy-7-phosphoheptulonate synthase